MYPECGIMEFQGRNPYTLRNYSIADSHLYNDATNQTLGDCFPYHKHYVFYAAEEYYPRMYELSRVHEFVLVVFPLKCGFIIVQVYVIT